MNYSKNPEKLTSIIIESIFKVHSKLGPGFYEVIYRRALVLELAGRNICVETEKPIDIYYNDSKIGSHRLDILVENLIIVELKAVEVLSRSHYFQTRAYLQATGLNIAILVNFSGDKADFRRINKK